MLTVKNAKNVGAPFTNASEWTKITYDFAQDTGAIEDYILANIDSNCVLVNFFAVVETAVTSADAVTIDLGVGAGGTEIWSDKLKGALTIGTVAGMGTFAPVKLTSGSAIVLGIEAFAVTAGKIHFYFEIASY